MIFKSASVAFLATILVLFSSTVGNIVSARILGPEGRGDYSAILSIAMFAGGLAQLGIPTALVFSAKSIGGVSRRFSNLSVAFISFLGLTIGLCLIFISGLHGEYGIYQYASALLLCAFYSALVYLQTISQVDASLHVNSLARCYPPVIFIILSIPIYFFGLNGFDLSLIYALALAFGGYFIYRMLFRRVNPNPSVQSFPKITKALNYYQVNVLGLFSGNVDKLWLISLSDPAGFGIYSVAFAGSRVVGSLQESLSFSIFSKFAGAIGAGELENLRSSTLLCFRLTFYPALIAVGLSYFLAEDFFSLIFGDGYSKAGVLFVILSLEALLGSSSWLLAQYYQAGGRPGVVVIRQIISMLPLMLFFVYNLDYDAAYYSAWILVFCSGLRLITTVGIFCFSERCSLRDFVISKYDIKTIKNMNKTGVS